MTALDFADSAGEGCVAPGASRGPQNLHLHPLHRRASWGGGEENRGAGGAGGSAVPASPALRGGFRAGLAGLGSASSSRRFLPGFSSGGQFWLCEPCSCCEIGQKPGKGLSSVQNNLGKRGLLSICVFLLRKEGSEQVPTAGGSIQRCRKGTVRALKSFRLVAFGCWVFRSRGVASGSPTKPPCAARD